MASRIDTLLRKIPEQLKSIEGQYIGALRDKEISDDLLYDIKNLIGDCQSALDWTATDLDRKYGKAADRSPYYPLQDAPAKFAAAMARDFPNVPQEVYAAMDRHQPYQPEKTVLRHLHDLARVNKHQDFTPQTRSEQRRIRAEGRGGGAVEWSPANVRFGSGVRINGVPVDPRTQMPVPSPLQTVTVMVYVGWTFSQLGAPVLPTLQSLSVLISEAVTDVRGAAGL